MNSYSYIRTYIHMPCTHTVYTGGPSLYVVYRCSLQAHLHFGQPLRSRKAPVAGEGGVPSWVGFVWLELVAKVRLSHRPSSLADKLLDPVAESGIVPFSEVLSSVGALWPVSVVGIAYNFGTKGG